MTDLMQTFQGMENICSGNRIMICNRNCSEAISRWKDANFFPLCFFMVTLNKVLASPDNQQEALLPGTEHAFKFPDLNTIYRLNIDYSDKEPAAATNALPMFSWTRERRPTSCA